MDDPITEQELQTLGRYAKNNEGYEIGMLIKKIYAAYHAQREEIVTLKARDAAVVRDAALVWDNQMRQTMMRREIALACKSWVDANDPRSLSNYIADFLCDKGLLTEDAPAASFVHVVGTPPNPPSVTVSSPSDYGKFDWASCGVDSNTPKMTTEERTRFDIRNLMESYCELVQRVEKLESPEREVVKVVMPKLTRFYSPLLIDELIHIRTILSALAEGKRVEITTEGE